MSLSMVLIPMAVAISVTSAETIQKIRQKHRSGQNEIDEAIVTRYNNVDLLIKTLTEHGVDVEVLSENRIIARFREGEIVFERTSPEGIFTMKICNIHDYEGLMCDLEMIEEEFNQNLQSYSYNKVKKNILEYEAFQIEKEEVMEDDSIVLTLTVD